MTHSNNNQAEANLRLLTSFWLSQSIYVIAKLGVADLIKDGSATVEVLAKKTCMNENSLYRVLRMLAAEGIFKELENNAFEVLPAGEFLLSDSSSSMRNAAIMYGDEIYKVWGNFSEVVKSGTPAWEKTYGKTYFEYLKETPESHHTFNRAMFELGRSMYGDSSIAEGYDFGTRPTIVDVGGGRGGLLNTILTKYSKITAVLFELESVLAEAKAAASNSLVKEKINYIAGNFFVSIPSYSSATYILKRVLHDWSDADSIKILANIAYAMNEDSRLLVVEYVLPEANTKSFGYLIDLHMMTILGGMERRASEYQALFKKAGLSLRKVYSTTSALSILEAVKQG